jgi:hypothetical protein
MPELSRFPIVVSSSLEEFKNSAFPDGLTTLGTSATTVQQDAKAAVAISGIAPANIMIARATTDKGHALEWDVITNVTRQRGERPSYALQPILIMPCTSVQRGSGDMKAMTADAINQAYFMSGRVPLLAGTTDEMIANTQWMVSSQASSYARKVVQIFHPNQLLNYGVSLQSLEQGELVLDAQVMSPVDNTEGTFVGIGQSTITV